MIAVRSHWISYLAALAMAGTLFAANHARAQTTAPKNPPQVQTEGQAPSDDLSDRLDRNKGVIRPKGDVDPNIDATPPGEPQGTMPVIPPPGSPGGDPRVQPK
jgi:hypothetical protein